MASRAARLLALSGLVCALLAPLGGGRPAQAAASGWLDPAPGNS